MFTTCNNARNTTIELFKRHHRRAHRNQLFARIKGDPVRLKCFEERRAGTLSQKRYLGLAQVKSEEITGSVGRNDDFDFSFRPLKMHMRDRWVNVALRANQHGWPPIKLIKVGIDYYVEDGHHRVSVARSTGIAFLDAEIWELTKAPTMNSMTPPPSSRKVTLRLKQKTEADSGHLTPQPIRQIGLIHRDGSSGCCAVRGPSA